jgi:hypothetical protein
VDELIECGEIDNERVRELFFWTAREALKLIDAMESR